MRKKILSAILEIIKKEGYILLSRNVFFAHAIWYDSDQQKGFLAINPGTRPLDDCSDRELKIISHDLKLDF